MTSAFSGSLLAFALLHSIFQGQICLLLQVFLDFPVPYNEKDTFFWVLVLKGLVSLHRTVQLQFLQRYLPGASILSAYCILHIECSTFHSIIFQDLE